MQRNVWIAIPAYTGMIHLATMRSIIADMVLLAERGDKVKLLDNTGNPMIAHSRDFMCAQFLDGDGTDMVFVDYDVTWPAGALLKLVDYPVDVVAGIYPKRIDPLSFFCRWLQDRKDLIADPETGLLEVEAVPAGFLRISRKALLEMVGAYPKQRFADKNAPKGYAHALFSNIHDGDLYFGEDYSFCKRWRDIGGKIWIDPEIPMGHIGHKTFHGQIGEWLKARPAA